MELYEWMEVWEPLELRELWEVQELCDLWKLVEVWECHSGGLEGVGATRAGWGRGGTRWVLSDIWLTYVKLFYLDFTKVLFCEQEIA